MPIIAVTGMMAQPNSELVSTSAGNSDESRLVNRVTILDPGASAGIDRRGV